MNKNFIKIISIVICLLLVSSVVSCGGETENKKNEKTSQKVYNTAFKQATTPVPNSTTALTEIETESEAETESETETETEAETEFTMPSTKKRTGKRGSFKQTSPMRKITSQQLLSEMGAGITLGDSFTAKGLGDGMTVEDYETYYENPVVAEELIGAYSAAGFSAVRIPISWTDHMDEKGAVDELWLDRIEEVVGFVLERGMYCIINSQNDQGWLNTSDSGFSAVKSRFSAMWKSIANRFISYDDHLIFEGVSDILKSENDKSDPAQTDIKNANAINQAFVNAVRSTGGNNAKRHLIISTYGAFVSSDALEGFTLPKDTVKNKLIAKVNIYIPSAFCLDESKVSAWGSNEEKEYLDSVLAVVNWRFSELKIPCIIGEFGVVDKGNASARAAYAKYLVSEAYNYYIVCFWNDNGSNMKLFDRENYQNVQEKIVKSIIGSAG